VDHDRVHSCVAILDVAKNHCQMQPRLRWCCGGGDIKNLDVTALIVLASVF